MMEKGIYQHIEANKFKSVLLVAIFACLVMTAGYLFGAAYGEGESGLIMAGVFTVFYAIIGYYSGEAIALKMNGAIEADKRNYNELYSTVDALAISAGLPTPKVFVMETPALNAFATGRSPKHSSVTVTTGLLEKLNKRELRGVLAHEMSHIGNYDIRLQTIVLVFAGVLTIMSDLFLRVGFHNNSSNDSKNKASGVIMIVALVFALLSPFVALLIQMSLSRKREFLADHTGAVLISDPEALASALEKIASDTSKFDKANRATAHLFINDPFKASKFASLFSTHPPIEDRIKLLREI